jgi:hypothetical protein
MYVPRLEVMKFNFRISRNTNLDAIYKKLPNCPWRKSIVWSANGQEICHIAATGLHAVYSILPGSKKDFWPVKTTRRGNREGFVTKFMISKFIHDKM